MWLKILLTDQKGKKEEDIGCASSDGSVDVTVETHSNFFISFVSCESAAAIKLYSDAYIFGCFKSHVIMKVYYAILAIDM